MPFASQAGLSIRTFEALAAHTKMITTNPRIKEYDFYSPENVLIIDRKNPVIDPEFIDKPYRPLRAEIEEKYSISSWVKTLFGDTAETRGEV